MNQKQILESGLLYHIYPLGACGAPMDRNQQAYPEERLLVLEHYLDHLQSLGVTMVYLGPVFESDSHGYDTRDYYQVDARLGSNDTLQHLSQQLHARGIRLILDGVFNHVGRGFWAFQDLIQNGADSAYRDWFDGIDFSQRSPLNDPFNYQPWEGHYSLVKLNTFNPALRQHLVDAVRFWIQEFDIDGLRLDAADCVEKDFWRFLRSEILRESPDFFFLGEIIHGDYRDWANAEMFDSTTNYVAYKGLWSSLNDRNYFEIDYTLDQQFGEAGAYQELPMYNFLDNHDVNRVASQLHTPAHLPLAYAMLFTIPGFPSLYYGSEIGMTGARDDFSDKALRPFFDPSQGKELWDHSLLAFIQHLSQIRKTNSALQKGTYQKILVAAEQFAYLRENAEQRILVLFNASDQTHTLTLPMLHFSGQAMDLLDSSFHASINSQAQIWLPQNSVRILQLRNA